MELKRVVVTGLGAVTPIGNSVSEYGDSLLKGVSGAGPITLFDASKFKTQFACEVKNFDPLKYFEKKLIKAGESVTFRFEINPLRDLGFVNREGKKYLDKGEYRIMVGDQSVSIYVI